MGQQHGHHERACQKCRISDLTWDFLNQMLYLNQFPRWLIHTCQKYYSRVSQPRDYFHLGGDNYFLAGGRGNYPVHCGMFIHISDLYLLDVSSIPPAQVWQSKMSPYIAKYSLLGAGDLTHSRLETPGVQQSLLIFSHLSTIFILLPISTYTF